MPASKSGDEDKVFDVAKPGKTAANSTSKPVIIGHKSMLKDPMVKEESVGIINGSEVQNQDVVDPNDKPSGNPQPAPAEAEPSTAPTVSRIKIEPVSGDISQDTSSENTSPTTETPSEKPAKKPIKLQILPPEPEEKLAEPPPTIAATKTIKVKTIGVSPFWFFESFMFMF